MLASEVPCLGKNLRALPLRTFLGCLNSLLPVLFCADDALGKLGVWHAVGRVEHPQAEFVGKDAACGPLDVTLLWHDQANISTKYVM